MQTSTLSFVERKRSSAHRIQLILSSNTFVVCWIGVLVLHIVSIVFLCFVGAVHLLIATDAVYRAVWLLRIQQQTLRVAGWTYLALATLHAVTIIRDIRQSIQFGRLTFSASTKLIQRSGSVPNAVAMTSTPGQGATCSNRLTRARAVFALHLRRFHKATSVTSSYFPMLLAVRQLVEIAAQIYQTNLFSRSVPNTSVVRKLLVLLLLNCLYMPIVLAIFRNKPGHQLAAVLAVDLVLDIACSTVVPMTVVLPRVLEYDWTTNSYPDSLRFNDVWFVTTLSEVRQVLVTSVVDYLTTIVPYIAVIDSLATLKTVLMRVVEMPYRPGSSTTIVPVPTSQADKTPAKPVESSTPLAVSKRRLLQFRLVDKITWGIALLVLSVHFHAVFREANKPATTCRLLMQPWLAQNLSCAVFSVNCYREGTEGDEEFVTSQMNRLDRSTLKMVVFSHCPALYIPPTITQFPMLLSIQTLNCTIADWPASAAITQSSHDKMAEVQLFATNMSHLPAGLMNSDLPTRLSLIIHDSNLTLLPEDTGDVWNGHIWPFFSLQHVPLKRLPASFHKVRASYLTLFDTHIESIDDDTLADWELQSLRLSYNQFLTRLPATGVSDLFFRLFEAQSTNVSSIPVWLDEWRRNKVPALTVTWKEIVFTLYGTPFCDSLDTAAQRETCQLRDSIGFEDDRYEIIRKLRPL